MFRRARTTSGRTICLSDQFPVIKVEEVMRGLVRFAGQPAVDLGTDVDWTANPHGNRSWALNLHTLRWLGRLVAEYERTGEPSHLDRARALAARWLWDSLAAHGELLADPALYREGHNHGLDQDIALLVVGCRLGRARWRDLAVRRMTASAELAIDAQGVLHEQAPATACTCTAGSAWPCGRSAVAARSRSDGWSPGGRRWRRRSRTPPSPTAASSRSATGPPTCARTASPMRGRWCSSWPTTPTGCAGPGASSSTTVLT
ncbi:hypothetical protein [Nonomuraea deserti]|uniref:hypothetical protein n=1 Tax=Nonomuraea deserti TaxID=1848322 RepID=UPI0026A3AA89